MHRYMDQLMDRLMDGLMVGELISCSQLKLTSFFHYQHFNFLAESQFLHRLKRFGRSNQTLIHTMQPGSMSGSCSLASTSDGSDSISKSLSITKVPAP